VRRRLADDTGFEFIYVNIKACWGRPGMELQWPTADPAESNDESHDSHDAQDDDPLNGKFQEADRQEFD
jgi:hypothetical protein